MLNQTEKEGSLLLPGPCRSRQLNHLAVSVFLIVFNVSATLVSSAQGKLTNFSFDNFSQTDGLPNNQIQCIYQDSKGWIWLGTSHGLSRFDGYRFVNFIPDPKDTSSLSGNLVRVIFEDSHGNLLIGTENGGLNLFDHQKEKFLHPYAHNPEFGTREVSVNTITKDSDGNIYLGTDRSLLKIDKNGTLSRITPETINHQTGFSFGFIRVIQFDETGKLWIGTSDGLLLYYPENNLIENIEVPLANRQSNEVFDIFRDNDGLLWIGTYSNGVLICDPSDKSIRRLDLSPYYDRTETVRSISKGILGDYWIGTRGGLYVYSKTRGVTGYFRHDDRDMRSLANNSVLDIYHDSRGETWIGTRGGLNLLAKSKQVFHDYSALPNDNHFLNSNIIYAFWIESNGKIWIGTEDGGINILDPEKGTFKFLTAKPGDPGSISQNCVKAFQEDGKGNLWIGTFWGGIDVYNLKTGNISHFRHSPDNRSSLSDNRVWAFCRDDAGGIWVGTTAGLDRYNPETGSFTHFPHLVNNKGVSWISIDSEKNIWFGTTDEVLIYNPLTESLRRYQEHARSFLEDSEKRCWIATTDKGIALYSKLNGPLRYFGENEGLANNQSLCIVEDNNRNLWISTSNGLSKFDPSKEQFRNFSSRDGLRNDQFNYGAAYKDDKGNLYFGGISGFNMFNPADILTEESDVPLVFTEFRIFNKPVPIGNDKNAILKKSISETDHIELRYDQNVFTLEFAALDFINSSSNLYSYYLGGFDKGWNEPSTSRLATYTNLNPGDYHLMIRRVLPGNSPPGGELTLGITIIPPYWMTWWFRSILILLICGLSYLIIRFIFNREKIKNELVFEKTKAKNLHELDMLKLRMFTNISHEIRTPLTLILGPLEKLISEKVPREDVSSHLNLVYRNTKQLDNLINQLLDFRKLETGNLRLETIQDDMVRLVSEVVQSFQEYAREKQITLEFHTLKKKLITFFDPDKIKTILNNLISNALKYTGEGGLVSVHLSLVFSDPEEDSLNNHYEEQYIEISVKDNGKGISDNNIEKIFTRFFRIDSKNVSTGTGIGLSLVKELVKLHKGTIDVHSKPGKGSKFTVRLPYEPELPENIRNLEAADIDKTGILNNDGHGHELHEDAHIMLIVEDNPDVRYFIRSHFEPVYSIYEARNGKEGLEIAVEVIPDVIISDILMPDIDGFEFCKRIKKDERTSHIPLLFLTALHSREHEMEGLSYGADDYITKPFDISILQTKVENMLQIRRTLKEKYTSQIVLKPSDLTITSPDERFLKRAIEVVEKNISNSDLDIEQFATEVGVSRMQLYRKFDALTNMTVKEFVRSIRLKRASQLLLDRKMSITEIAYAVGFKDLSHFRKCFHREFGMSASEYINTKNNQVLN
jgi:signal transduction histidine kinase/ligand-binding sensor domain-containing protein/DNA-binding response OmpR family regulator